MLSSISQLFSQVAQNRNYWLFIFVSGLLMEAIALLYQYVGGYEPCILCIHIRLWTFAFIITSLIVFIIHRNKYVLVIGHLALTAIMLGMLNTSWQLLQTEKGNILGSCSYFLDMPAWFAVDQWFPALFEVRASCAESPELLFGITMAEMLTMFSIIMLAISLILSIFALAIHFHRQR